VRTPLQLTKAGFTYYDDFRLAGFGKLKGPAWAIRGIDKTEEWCYNFAWWNYSTMRKAMKSLDRAIQILCVIAEHNEPVGLTQIARTTGMPTSSVHRILAVLQSHGLIVQSQSDRRYGLGYGLVKLAQSAIRNLPGYYDATSYLTEIRDRWNECCFVGSLVDDQVLCLQTMEVDNPHRMAFYVRPGRTMPFNCSAAGKAILAYQDAQKIEEILSKIEFQAFTPRTITEKEELKRHLSVIREQGYALCEQELEIGVSAAAVPIRDASGKVNSYIAVVAPTARLKMHLAEGLVDMLKSVSKRMS
jgi:DNA-binding IclR family transcriptional regulator